MPIGTNFQTDLPYLTSSQKYLNSAANRTAMARLKTLKVHEPNVNNIFYEKWKEAVWDRFGDHRTYEDIVWIKKSMDEFGEGGFVGLEEYLAIPAVSKFWEDTFKNKDQELLKKNNNKKKKKKYKGSMDP